LKHQRIGFPLRNDRVRRPAGRKPSRRPAARRPSQPAHYASRSMLIGPFRSDFVAKFRLSFCRVRTESASSLCAQVGADWSISILFCREICRRSFRRSRTELISDVILGKHARSRARLVDLPSRSGNRARFVCVPYAR
jgi:hypothetical protein